MNISEYCSELTKISNSSNLNIVQDYSMYFVNIDKDSNEINYDLTLYHNMNDEEIENMFDEIISKTKYSYKDRITKYISPIAQYIYDSYKNIDIFYKYIVNNLIYTKNQQKKDYKIDQQYDMDTFNKQGISKEEIKSIHNIANGNKRYIDECNDKEYIMPFTKDFSMIAENQYNNTLHIYNAIDEMIGSPDISDIFHIYNKNLQKIFMSTSIKQANKKQKYMSYLTLRRYKNDTIRHVTSLYKNGATIDHITIDEIQEINELYINNKHALKYIFKNTELSLLSILFTILSKSKTNISKKEMYQLFNKCKMINTSKGYKQNKQIIQKIIQLYINAINSKNTRTLIIESKHDYQ